MLPRRAAPVPYTRGRQKAYARVLLLRLRHYPHDLERFSAFG